MRFEEALKAMREGKKVQKGTLTYRLDELDNGSSCLMVEYPTWQEAVNSKEFKGEDK